jgi:hypothetical protein
MNVRMVCVSMCLHACACAFACEGAFEGKQKIFSLSIENMAGPRFDIL